MAVSIVADSSCDLTPAQAAAAGIRLVPVIVRIGDREYRDGVDLSLNEFYARLEGTSELPSTAPPSTETFAEVFRDCLRTADEAIFICVSAKISKLYDNASAAADMLGGRVHVFDSKTISGGLGLLVTGAARLARDGADAKTILAALEKWTQRQHGFAAYPDLKFLARSGRINKAQMALGLMMRVFPVSRVGRSGEMEGETTVKSWEQAKETLASAASRKIERPALTRVAITHTNDPQLGQFVADGLRRRLTAPLKELTIHVAGPSVGANAGPGAAGVFMLEE